MTEKEIEYLLVTMNEALEKNVWHDVTPEYLAELKRKSKERKRQRELANKK